MKTYKKFTEAAVLALPALKAAPYVIPALGAGANILKGMMKSDASDRFKARQRPTGRTGKASYKDKLRAKQRQDAADKRQSADQHGPSFERDAREAARRREQNRLTPDQRLDNLIGKAARELGIKLPKGNTLAITNRETGLSDSEKKRVADLMGRVKAEKERRKVQQPEKDILDYGRNKEGIAARPKKQVKEENKHRDAKLFYQYKQLQDPKPKKPLDVLKSKKGLA